MKQITTGGTLRFPQKLRSLANAMVDQHIGLEETENGIWATCFTTILLATFDERVYIIETGRASIPKSASMRSYHAASSSAPSSTQASSLMLRRQPRNGAASGPTG